MLSDVAAELDDDRMGYFLNDPLKDLDRTVRAGVIHEHELVVQTVRLTDSLHATA
jgi:hypothetical protein